MALDDQIERAGRSGPSGGGSGYGGRVSLFELSITPYPDSVIVLPFKGQVPEGAARLGRDRVVSLTHTEGGQQETATERDMEALLFANVRRALRGGKLVPLRDRAYEYFKVPMDTLHQQRPVVYLDGVEFRVLPTGGSWYLALDAVVAPFVNLAQALSCRALDPDLCVNIDVIYAAGENASGGRLLGCRDTAQVTDVDTGTEVSVPLESVAARAGMGVSQIVARAHGLPDPVIEVRKHTYVGADHAPRKRYDLTRQAAQFISTHCFPVRIGQSIITLDPTAASTRDLDSHLIADEPALLFDGFDASKRGPAVMNGLKHFGPYQKPRARIDLAILSIPEKMPSMAALVQSLGSGGSRSFPYGMQRAFECELAVVESMETPFDGYMRACEELVRRPAAGVVKVVLVYMPDAVGRTGWDSLYYKVKAYLCEQGFVSQMIDDNVLADPTWKDYSLALDLFAKAGYKPWVLDDHANLDDVDLFVGLSWSWLQGQFGSRRAVGHINVFDKYGEWQFFEGSGSSFDGIDFSQRADAFGRLMRVSLSKYRATNPSRPCRNVEVHYSKKFGRAEKEAITNAARLEAQDACITFVHISDRHPLRLYDLDDPEGRVARGTYLVMGEGDVLLATTGRSVIARSPIGTPQPLRIRWATDPPGSAPAPEQIAWRVFALSKLNWASTNSFCRQPITIKYANEIARLTNVFELGQWGRVNSALAGRPWWL